MSPKLSPGPTCCPRVGRVECCCVQPSPNADSGSCYVLLATSLYDDPAAELHEDASAMLREHLALSSCSILRRSSPSVRRERLPGSRWRPRGELPWPANHGERPVSRDTALRISCRTPTLRACEMAVLRSARTPKHQLCAPRPPSLLSTTRDGCELP